MLPHQSVTIVETPEPTEEKRPASGFFRGMLFAAPVGGLLWALLIAAVRALLRHL